MKFESLFASFYAACLPVLAVARLCALAVKLSRTAFAQRIASLFLLIPLLLCSLSALARADYFDEPIAEPELTAPPIEQNEPNPDAYPLPEPDHIMHACEVFGANFFYIPGTNTCLRISGYVQSTMDTGDQLYARQIHDLHRYSAAWQQEATFRFHTSTETDLGTLRGFMELRADWQAGGEDGSANENPHRALRFGYIELGGIRAGIDETIFSYWTGYYGSVMNDNIIDPAHKRTNSVSYTYNAGNGFAAVFGVEQGNNYNGDGNLDNQYDEYNIIAPYTEHGGFRFRSDGSLFHKTMSMQTHNWMPNLAGGVKLERPWGVLSTVAGYDSYNATWAGKSRIDLNVTKHLSLFLMQGYKIMKDFYNLDIEYGENGRKQVGARDDGSPIYRYALYRQVPSLYGDWGGHWATWLGGTYKFNPMTSINFQNAYSTDHTFSSTANISHELGGGLITIAEVSYKTWGDDYGRTLANGDHYGVILKGKDAIQGRVRVIRYW